MISTARIIALLGLAAGLAGCRGAEATSPPRPEPQAGLASATEEPCFFRNIEGLDTGRRCMTNEEIARELGDPAAPVLLRARPASLDALVGGLDNVPGLLRQSDLVGEGSQVSSPDREADRSLRYVVSWRRSGATPAVFVSARPPGGPMPDSAVTELIGYDPRKNAHNYYLFTGEPKAWTWAGDSGHAFQEGSAGKGCFACHRNGRLVMKELAAPWSNWHSARAGIPAERVPEKVAREELFLKRRSAADLETDIKNRTASDVRLWVDARIDPEERVAKVAELLRPLFETTTVNLASSDQRSVGGDGVGVPPMFLLNHDLLSSSLVGLRYGAVDLSLPREGYASALRAFNLRLEKWGKGGLEYAQQGATFQALLVPVASLEDNEVVQEIIAGKVISARFAVSALMVDFPNPVYSPLRAALLSYARKIPGGRADGNDVPAQFAKLVEEATQRQPPCDRGSCEAERQFLRTWKDDRWKASSERAIDDYLAAVRKRLQTEPAKAATDYVALSLSRGTQLDRTPSTCDLAEFDLLLPCASYREVVHMRADGTLSDPQPPITGCGRDPPKRCSAGESPLAPR